VVASGRPALWSHLVGQVLAPPGGGLDPHRIAPAWAQQFAPYRLLHHASVVVTDGDSYCMREARAEEEPPEEELTNPKGGDFYLATGDRNVSDRKDGRRFGGPQISVSGIALSLVANAPAVRGATMLSSALVGVTARAGCAKDADLQWQSRTASEIPARPARVWCLDYHKFQMVETFPANGSAKLSDHRLCHSTHRR
jgi:hypothetical protein